MDGSHHTGLDAVIEEDSVEYGDDYADSQPLSDSHMSVEDGHGHEEPEEGLDYPGHSMDSLENEDYPAEDSEHGHNHVEHDEGHEHGQGHENGDQFHAAHDSEEFSEWVEVSSAHLDGSGGLSQTAIGGLAILGTVAAFFLFFRFWRVSNRLRGPGKIFLRSAGGEPWDLPSMQNLFPEARPAFLSCRPHDFTCETSRPTFKNTLSNYAPSIMRSPRLAMSEYSARERTGWFVVNK
ncbi:hypothetical protein PLICRDRAFT_551697 [Plicaturopsis crispa FD-325 SS-3]|nr:hypothetical protein PLICRDRAFT_551697 [Plicaturopsis crispa FD-325 SS-3]